MRRLILGAILGLTFVSANQISIAKFKQMDYVLAKNNLSLAEFKKLDYELCKKIELENN